MRSGGRVITVILLGGRGEYKGAKRIASALSRHGGSILVQDHIISQSGEGDPRFLVGESSELPKLDCPHAIVIFEKDRDRAAGRVISDRHIAIVSGDCGKAVESLMSSNTTAITCGMSLRDTLTFSSIHDSGAVVSLQRAILTVFGHAVEPFEFPIRWESREDPYLALSICAVLLLSEQIVPGVSSVLEL